MKSPMTVVRNNAPTVAAAKTHVGTGAFLRERPR